MIFLDIQLKAVATRITNGASTINVAFSNRTCLDGSIRHVFMVTDVA